MTATPGTPGPVHPAPPGAQPEPAQATLRVVRGVPADVDISVEVAVLAAVLSTRGGGAPAEAAPLSAWAARDRLVRQPLAPALDGWRASSLPR